MGMSLVGHHDLDVAAPPGVEVDGALVEALKAHWLDKATHLQQQMVDSFLVKVREKSLWVACDCLGPVARPPILMVAKRESGTHYIFQKTSRPAHSSSCLFHKTQDQYRHERLASLSTSVIDPGDVPNVIGARKTKERAAAPLREACSSGPEQSRNVATGDSLIKALAWIIEGAGLHITDGAAPSLRQQWADVAAFCKSVFVADGLSLFNVVILGERRLLNDDWQRSFRAICSRYPAGRIPTAFILLKASSLSRIDSGSTQIEFDVWEGEGRAAAKSSHTAIVRSEIKYSARDGDEARAPYLVMLKVTADTMTSMPRILRGVAQPIESLTSLFPVDSNNERHTLSKLRSVAAARLRHGGRIEIEKPVRGRVGPLGLCRPDFIVRRDGHHDRANTLIVETMGYSDPDYLSGKLAQFALMEAMATEVVQDDRSGSIKRAEADDLLFRKVAAWAINSGAS